MSADKFDAAPDPQADEWARLDGANADEDARGRAAQVLREAGDIHPTSIPPGWFNYAADALIAAGLIKGTSDNGPMLSGEDLRAASEKVDQWLDEPTPEQALRAHIADLLTDVDHFDGCKANEDCDCDFCVCTCLIGRIRWAINAEQVPAETGGAA